MISPKKLNVILLVLIAAQLLLAVPAQYALIRLSGDAVYARAYEIIETADEVIGKVTAYALMAALGIAWYYKVIRTRATVMYAAALLIPHAAATVMAAALQSDFTSRPGLYLLPIWIDVIPELLITAIVIFAGAALRKRRYGLKKKVVGADGKVRYVPTKHMYKKLSDITEVFLAAELSYLAIEVIGEIISTVSFFITYDSPTGAEILSIVTSYALYLVYSVIGFFVMRAVLKLAEKGQRRTVDAFDLRENL